MLSFVYAHECMHKLQHTLISPIALVLMSVPIVQSLSCLPPFHAAGLQHTASVHPPDAGAQHYHRHDEVRWERVAIGLALGSPGWTGVC